MNPCKIPKKISSDKNFIHSILEMNFIFISLPIFLDFVLRGSRFSANRFFLQSIPTKYLVFFTVKPY